MLYHPLLDPSSPIQSGGSVFNRLAGVAHVAPPAWTHVHSDMVDNLVHADQVLNVGTIVSMRGASRFASSSRRPFAGNQPYPGSLTNSTPAPSGIHGLFGGLPTTTPDTFVYNSGDAVVFNQNFFNWFTGVGRGRHPGPGGGL